jgi:type II secretory pathway pseudopilin PulG
MRSLITNNKHDKFGSFQKHHSARILSRGFTAVEIILVISLMVVLLTLVTVNLFSFQHKSQLSSTIESFLADYKEQQIKAMVGDTSGTATPSAFGIHLETNSYTEFQNAYGTNNFTVNLPSGTQFTATTFANSQVLFATGSGEVATGNNTITITDTGNNSQKVITINRYGVVTGVN